MRRWVHPWASAGHRTEVVSTCFRAASRGVCDWTQFSTTVPCVQFICHVPQSQPANEGAVVSVQGLSGTPFLECSATCYSQTGKPRNPSVYLPILPALKAAHPGDACSDSPFLPKGTQPRTWYYCHTPHNAVTVDVFSLS